MLPRLCPQRELPPYAFLPGQGAHPEKPGGHMYGQKISVKHLDPHMPFSNEDYLYALDLFNHGYYWESHVWLEALWNQAGRRGTLADFLKALILLCAAGVKKNLAENLAAQGHLKRAQELLGQIIPDGEFLAGLRPKQIQEQISQAQASEEFFPQGLIPSA